jgi:fatty-acyl-CoA synthase
VKTPITIPEALAAVAEIDDRGFTFVGADGRETFVPFRSLAAEARGRAGALQALSLAPGDRVVLIVPDHHAFIVTFLAAVTVGLVPVPVYPPFSLARLESWQATATGIIRAASAAAIVTVEDVRALLQAQNDPVGTTVVTVDELDAASRPPAPVAVGPDDLAFLQFTSGSTGAPRGVMVSHRNVAANCAGLIREFLGWVPDGADVSGVSWLPLYHDMGLVGCVLAPLYFARPVVFLATVAFLKRPSLWFELIHRHRATVTFAPNFGYALAARRISDERIASWDLSCLRVAGCGGEPISAETLRTFTERFAPAGLSPEAPRPSYGMAESTLLVTHGRVGEPWRSEAIDADRLRRDRVAIPATEDADAVELVGCGAPLAGHTVAIVDACGRPLPERTVGEIEIRGPSLARGYFGNPEATAASFRGNGPRTNSLRTGDLGYLADGELFVTGRKKDLVIVYGRNYEPQTIEWSIAGLPGVRANGVVAFSRPGARGTEELVVACEVATSDRETLATAVRARVSDELALSVEDVVLLPSGSLPKTSSGKAQRAKTRELYLDGTLHGLAAAPRATRRRGQA